MEERKKKAKRLAKRKRRTLQPSKNVVAAKQLQVDKAEAEQGHERGESANLQGEARLVVYDEGAEGVQRIVLSRAAEKKLGLLASVQRTATLQELLEPLEHIQLSKLAKRKLQLRANTNKKEIESDDEEEEEEQAEEEEEEVEEEEAKAKEKLEKEEKRKQEKLLSLSPSARLRAVLQGHHRAQFDRWTLQLLSGFNLLLYGFGTKRPLMEEFAGTLEQWPRFFLHGYLEPTSSKDSSLMALVSMLGSIMGASLPNSSSTLAQCQQLRHFLLQQRNNNFAKPLRAVEHVLIVVHNIDGPALRSEAAQTVLSILANLPPVHLIASIDHCYAPLLWDDEMADRFKWIPVFAPTYQHYDLEAAANPLINRSALGGWRRLQQAATTTRKRQQRNRSTKKDKTTDAEDAETTEDVDVVEEEEYDEEEEDKGIMNLGAHHVLKSVPPDVRRMFALLAEMQTQQQRLLQQSLHSALTTSTEKEQEAAEKAEQKGGTAKGRGRGRPKGKGRTKINVVEPKQKQPTALRSKVNMTEFTAACDREMLARSQKKIKQCLREFYEHKLVKDVMAMTTVVGGKRRSVAYIYIDLPGEELLQLLQKIKDGTYDAPQEKGRGK